MRCATWEQVDVFLVRKLRKGKFLSLKVPFAAKVGIDVTVYEQARRFARVGAGIQISFNAMKVLRTFGLEPSLRAAAFYPRSWNNRNFDTGEIRFDMIFGETAEKRYGAPYLLAHRGDLHAAARERRRLPGRQAHRARASLEHRVRGGQVSQHR